jgi:hypothetical protein
VLPPTFLINPAHCTSTQTVLTTTQQTAWHSNGAWQTNQEPVRHARHIDSQPQTQTWQNRGGQYGRNNNGHQAQHRRGAYKAKPHTRSPDNSEPKPVQDYKMILTRHTNPPAALTSQAIQERTGDCSCHVHKSFNAASVLLGILTSNSFYVILCRSCSDMAWNVIWKAYLGS